jgi:hypothetical protein
MWCFELKLLPKVCSENSAEMLVKRNSILYTVYFVLEPFHIVLIGWGNCLQSYALSLNKRCQDSNRNDNQHKDY